MSDTPRWRRYLRFWGPDHRADVDDELAFHLETRERDLVAAGMTPTAARAQAEREFGDVRGIRTACVKIDERRQRHAHRLEVTDAMWNDLTFTARTLRKSPGFTLTAILCIALGVGITTTIFSAVNAILLRPLPYAHPDRLVAIYSGSAAINAHHSNISYLDYLSWRDENRTFTGIGMWTWTSLTLSGGDGEAERLEGAEVTPNLFPLLGVDPLVGRTFVKGEDRAGGDRVLLLSYGLWQRRFGGDRAIVGRTVTVDGLPYTVVGVMPRRFAFPDRGQVWIPLTPRPQELRENRMYAGAIGRLAPGVSLAQARADLATVSARLQREYTKENFGWVTEVSTLRDDLVGDLRKPVLILFGAVTFVLLITCANVANLMLARGAAREREMAIRTAVGAGRGRLVRQMLTESMTLAVLGGVLGGIFAALAVPLLRFAFPGDVPFYITFSVDGATLGFAVLVAALAGALFGIIPAFRSTHLEPSRALREGARGSGSLVRSRLRRALVVTELALSVMLLAGAMLLIRSYRALEGTDLGFDEHGILSMRISLPESGYAQPAKRAAFYQQLFDRVAALPGVQVVGSAQGIPFSGWDVQAGMSIEGRPAPRPGHAFISHFQEITPDYFKAIGVPILRGRGIAPADRDSSAHVGVINQIFAERAFPGENPIGKRVKIGDLDSPDPWITIVGVARDFRHYRLPQPMGPAIYLPYFAEPVLTQTLAIRTSLADPLSLVPAVRRAIRDIDAEVPAYQIQTFEQVVSRSLWRQRVQGQVLGVFAALALLLAAVGLYGVIAYAVAQRTRELGVRIALGATRRNVLALVMGQGARLVVAGACIGLAGAFALTSVVASLLYGVEPTDPVTFLATPIVLVIVAMLASWLPAWRATKVDPLVAMRVE
ncbi:MAG TPA: ABC transporter permease [Gemmatimonadaceae bacterium]